MAWPTNKPNSNQFNSDSDSIKQSRPELKTMSDAVNDIVDFIDTSGIKNGSVLIYNSSNQRLEVGENLLNISAGTNITIDQDSAGGITINAVGGLSNPLTADLETNQYIIGHLPGDDSASGGSTAMRFTDNGEIHLFQSGQFTGGTGSGAYEVKLANAKFDRYFSANPPGPGPAGDNTNYGPISLFSQDLNTDDSAGTVGTARIGVLNNADGIIISNSKVDGATTFTGEIRLNQRDGILLKNSSNQFDSAGENESGITLQTTSGSVILDPNNTIYLKYTNWPSTDGSAGQVLQTNGSGQLAWVSGGGGGDFAAGDNIAISQPDSAGSSTISFASPMNNPVNVNDQVLSNAGLKGYSETVYTGLSTSGTLTPAVSDGNVQTVTLSGNITINALSSPANGDSVTIIITQPGSGGPYTLSSTMKFAGGNKTLSTAANAIDVLSIFYDGTNHLASLSTNFS